MDKYVCRMRRERLGRAIGDGALAFIPGAENKTRNSDVDFPFRQESDMLYLSGWNEPDSLLVIIGGIVPRSILFCAPKDPEQELWTGKRYGPEGAVSEFGFDEACANSPATPVIARIATLLSSAQEVFSPPQSSGRSLFLLRDILKEHEQSSPETKFSSLSVLGEHRLIKDDHEIELIRKACMISAIAHRNILRIVRPGMNECELEAEITYRFRKAGGDPLHAYPPIVAAGIHACTLHYTENNTFMNDGDLVLVDAGCEIEGYASDITRTFPVNGRFSPAQREVYAIVLAAQKAAIEKAVVGNTLHAVHRAATDVITRGLIDLRLLKGARGKGFYLALRSCKRFFPHGTSHFLGLDVHDVGDYKNNNKHEHMRTLEPGMVITVEPGIYIPPAPDIPPLYWNIGIRIEDDVLITSGGPQILTAEAPKEIAEIEANMRHGDVPQFT